MDPLDELPLEVLLSLHDALAGALEAAAVRAARREAGLGWHVEVARSGVDLGPARFDPEPIPMEEAEQGVESLHLRFDR